MPDSTVPHLTPVGQKGYRKTARESSTFLDVTSISHYSKYQISDHVINSDTIYDLYFVASTRSIS